MTEIQFEVWLDNGSNVDLSEVLRAIEDQGPALHWTFRYLEAVSKPEANLNILEIEAQINSAKDGQSMAWAELLRFADQLHQTINCFVEGQSSIGEVKLELEDSSYWVVSSNINGVIASFQKKVNSGWR